jgi:hypothetical protein
MSDEYVPPARRCTVCDREATASESPPLCSDHAAAVDADTTDSHDGGGEIDPDTGSADTAPSGAGDTPRLWNDVRLDKLMSNTFPETLHDREQWMGKLAGEKMPFAPWGDRDHSDAEPDVDARYKWGLSENYVTGDSTGVCSCNRTPTRSCSSTATTCGTPRRVTFTPSSSVC